MAKAMMSYTTSRDTILITKRRSLSLGRNAVQRLDGNGAQMRRTPNVLIGYFQQAPRSLSSTSSADRSDLNCIAMAQPPTSAMALASSRLSRNSATTSQPFCTLSLKEQNAQSPLSPFLIGQPSGF